MGTIQRDQYGRLCYDQRPVLRNCWTTEDVALLDALLSHSTCREIAAAAEHTPLGRFTTGALEKAVRRYALKPHRARLIEQAQNNQRNTRGARMRASAEALALHRSQRQAPPRVMSVQGHLNIWFKRYDREFVVLFLAVAAALGIDLSVRRRDRYTFVHRSEDLTASTRPRLLPGMKTRSTPAKKVKTRTKRLRAIQQRYPHLTDRIQL